MILSCFVSDCKYFFVMFIYWNHCWLWVAVLTVVGYFVFGYVWVN